MSNKNKEVILGFCEHIKKTSSTNYGFEIISLGYLMGLTEPGHIGAAVKSIVDDITGVSYQGGFVPPIMERYNRLNALVKEAYAAGLSEKKAERSASEITNDLVGMVTEPSNTLILIQKKASYGLLFLVLGITAVAVVQEMQDQIDQTVKDSNARAEKLQGNGDQAARDSDTKI